MQNLTEEITVKQTKFGNYDVYYVKSENREENNVVFQNKAILSKYGAKWNGPNKVWFWFVDKQNPQITLDKIKAALNDLNYAVTSSTASTTSGSPEAQKLLIDIDKVIAAISTENPTEKPTETPIKSVEIGISPQNEDQIKTKLENFKKMLVNIEDDEQFKETMKHIIDFKSAQGYQFSLLNALLILMQNKNATIVNSKSNWESKYNRTVNPNANPLIIWAPQGPSFTLPKEKIEAAKIAFYAKIGKQEGQKLTPNEIFQLERITKNKIQASKFKLVPVYDAADTTQIEGTEDYIKKSQDVSKDIQTSAMGTLSEEVRPIYTALVDFAKENNIDFDTAEDLGGAKGLSAGGKIRILKNKGNDIGLTKTLAHEITHELLHQKYLSQKGGEASKFHIGQMSRDVVEQQAELSAWMFMYAFGFDLKTTSLNYTIMWGGNKENMVQVFDTVSKVVNYLIDNVNKRLKKPVAETQGNFKHGNLISPDEIARLLGVEKDYDKLTHQELYESIRKKII